MIVKKILDYIKSREDKIIRLYANGWYRVAVAELDSDIATAGLVKIGTSYSNQAPMTCIIGLATAYSSAQLEEIVKKLHSTVKHIDKIRIQYNSNTKTFYLDIHYNLSNLTNYCYINFLGKDSYWKFIDDNTVTEYTTVAELNL